MKIDKQKHHSMDWNPSRMTPQYVTKHHISFCYFLIYKKQEGFQIIIYYEFIPHNYHVDLILVTNPCLESHFLYFMLILSFR